MQLIPREDHTQGYGGSNHYGGFSIAQQDVAAQNL
jgi:hypothetical protein